MLLYLRARLSVSRVLSVRVRVRGESLTDTITKRRDRLHAARARIRKNTMFRGELRWGFAPTVIILFYQDEGARRATTPGPDGRSRFNKRDIFITAPPRLI